MITRNSVLDDGYSLRGSIGLSLVALLVMGLLYSLAGAGLGRGQVVVQGPREGRPADVGQPRRDVGSGRDGHPTEIEPHRAVDDDGVRNGAHARGGGVGRGHAVEHESSASYVIQDVIFTNPKKEQTEAYITGRFG